MVFKLFCFRFLNFEQNKQIKLITNETEHKENFSFILDVLLSLFLIQGLLMFLEHVRHAPSSQAF